MVSLPKTPPADADPTAAKKPRDTWEKIITTTPVILTVVATVLAGLSSSEMTQAQYHRSLAAQNESKSADQWSFAQFKKTRGVIGETKRNWSQPAVTRGGLDDLQAAAKRLSERMEHGQNAAAQLVQAIGAAHEELKEASQPLQEASERLLKVAREKAAAAKQSAAEIAREAGKEDVRKAFAYLQTNQLPEVAEKPWSDPQIEQATQAIDAGKPKEEITGLVLPIPKQHLEQAIQVAEDNARAFEEAAKAPDRALWDLDQLVRQAATLAGEFHEAASEVGLYVPAGNGKLDALRSEADEVARADRAIQFMTRPLDGYHAAREDYNARRNDREAQNNFKVSALYEVQVHRSGATSERHQTRSKNFFYGMLLAQAGVAIASLSLAARQKSALWGLAGAAGLLAVAFSTYVYLYL